MTTSFRTGLRDYLISQYDLADLIGGRVHASVLPDKAILPAIVYHVITNLGRITHDGPVALRNPRVQFDIWGTSIDECEPIASQLEKALLGYRGPMGNVDYTAGWTLESTIDDYEPETKLRRISLDFVGWYGTD